MMTISKSKDILKIRNYFGEHDKTAFEHWAYSFLDSLAKRVSGEEDNLNKEPISEDENSELSAAKELLLQAKYQLEAIDNQFPTKGTKAVIQEIENFLK